MTVSQSVKITESGGLRGHDAGKTIKGRKRHAMVDTHGRGLTLDNHPASVQDRDGAPSLMRASRQRWPFVKLAFMGSGYRGDPAKTGERRFRMGFASCATSGAEARCRS